jgi:DNA-binding GntR family transcriptional regulator
MVTKLSNAEIRERLSIRISLETLAAIETSRRIRDEHLTLLAGHLNAIESCIATNDTIGCSRADRKFHRCIWELSGNQTLCKMLDRLTVPLFAFVLIARSKAALNLREVTHPHQPIADAIARADPRLIYNAVFEHIATSYNEFLISEGEILRIASLGANQPAPIA